MVRNVKSGEYMRNNIILGMVFTFFLILSVPVYAQWGLFEKNPIDLVKEELKKGTQYSDEENNPSKWVASSLKGDFSIIGWKSQKTEKDDTYLVSYTFKDSKDANEKGWWWEVNTKEHMVRIVLFDSELTKKYSLGDSNRVTIELLKGMSEFTVKTLYGEPNENDNDPLVSHWSYYIDSVDNQQHSVLKIDINSGEVYQWGYYKRDQ